jgi:hypothetical protein
MLLAMEKKKICERSYIYMIQTCVDDCCCKLGLKTRLEAKNFNYHGLKFYELMDLTRTVHGSVRTKN